MLWLLVAANQTLLDSFHTPQKLHNDPSKVKSDAI
jgi:hypothetical protein